MQWHVGRYDSRKESSWENLPSARARDGLLVIGSQPAFGASFPQAAEIFLRGSNSVAALNRRASIILGESFRLEQLRS
jgi:hypothetical protein